MTIQRILVVLALLAGALWSVPTGAFGRGSGGPEQVCDDPTDTMTLFARKLGPGKIGYGLTPETASIPGPPLEMTEGECLAIDLVNQTTKRVSLHFHGVDYTVRSDGTRLNDSCVAPGRSRTYVIAAHAPAVRADGSVDPGSAGYWHYHDHCQGTPHGTGGIRKGLFGALVVRRPGDPIPDEQVVLVMNNISFNNKVAPETPMPEVAMGTRVEFVVIGHGELFHTFHLHGHRWADTRTGAIESIGDTARLIDNRTVGPADSFGFQVIAGEGVGPGAWMYHCHVQSHSDVGMAGLFIVDTPGGQRTVEASRTIDAFHSSHAGAGHGAGESIR